MAGAVLDSHALYWIVTGQHPLSDKALVAIGQAQKSRRLFVSPITAWELALASKKPSHKAPPNLGGTPAVWFEQAVEAVSARIAQIDLKVAVEAAGVAASTGHKDPADCYLMATARARKVPLITQDAAIIEIGLNGFVDVIIC